jgi:hypothetical protein
MSSSDQVRITFLEETVPGELDQNGDLGTCRILSDSLSGTPVTVESAEVGNGNRQSQGQGIVGLDVAGGFAVNLSPDPFHDAMIACCMLDTWSVEVDDTDDFVLDVAAGTLTKTNGVDMTTLFADGDLLYLTGMDDEENNDKMIYAITVTADVITCVLADKMVDGTSTGATLSLMPYVEIGSIQSTYSFIKDFLDLTEDSITYLGQAGNGFDFTFAFNEYVTGNYAFAGTGWQSPVPPDSDGRTIDPIGNNSILNSSQDMGLVVLDGEKVDFCIKTLNLAVDNGLQAIQCIGRTTPSKQIPSSAVVKVTMEAYLSNTNFDMVRNKIENTPVSISYYALNSDGQGYAFQIPSLELSFPDPANDGKGTQAMLNMEGTAKENTTFGNTLRIYRVNT